MAGYLGGPRDTIRKARYSEGQLGVQGDPRDTTRSLDIQVDGYVQGIPRTGPESLDIQVGGWVFRETPRISNQEG